MTDKAAIRELREKVEAGELTWVEREAVFTTNSRESYWCVQAYQGSLDAALALHEAVLPDFHFMITASGACVSDGKPGNLPGSVSAFATANTPARAWLIAILKAMEND